MVINVFYWNLFVLSKNTHKMAINQTNWLGQLVVSNSSVLS